MGMLGNMARLTEQDKELILADFHTGYFTVRELAEKYNTSHTTINKLTKGVEPKHKDKVDKLISIKSDLATESLQEVYSVDNVVKDRTKHLVFFQNAAIRGQQKANDLLEEVAEMKDLLAYANLTKTNKETVLGKDPETVINNANVQSNDTAMQINIIRDN